MFMSESRFSYDGSSNLQTFGHNFFRGAPFPPSKPEDVVITYWSSVSFFSNPFVARLGSKSYKKEKKRQVDNGLFFIFNTILYI